MNNQTPEWTLLSEGQIWGNSSEPQLEVIKKYGTQAAITDLCILTGCYFDKFNIADNNYNIAEDNLLPGITGSFWTKADTGSCNDNIYVVDLIGHRDLSLKSASRKVIRPVLRSSHEIFSQISSKRVKGYNGIEEVEYGEYPQNVASEEMQKILESRYKHKILDKTGRSYTFGIANDIKFLLVNYKELEYNSKKYIRVRANSIYDGKVIFQLSNGIFYRDNNYVWVEVSPVKWLIDDETETLISKKGLVSGVKFLDENIEYKGDFNKTKLKIYLDKYMMHDLFQNTTLFQNATLTQAQTVVDSKKIEKAKKKINPYNFKFEQVSEEEIIRGAIESGVAVFLHGPSSEGKSARVKQIDSTCEIIYLRNATPESLNGKSVYNQTTGEMIDIKPSWLRKLEEKCQKEPDKFHIVFFDEITNALPSIQGIAFNIVLDREVNGVWKLPENARIVAAGNDMKDSLAANQLAEPLFNRFAHVYIKTTTESWLKWASENNIHPAIYSYIAYTNGNSLRSKYDGEKPNADPRKWELASRMLYATGNPEMLRALVGEDITREFVKFCNQSVITLDDVINENYTDKDIEMLSTAERYATTMGLLQVDANNLDKVRSFLSKLGQEFCSIFNLKWCHGDEERLELIAEAELTKKRIRW